MKGNFKNIRHVVVFVGMWCLLAVSYSSLSAADKPVKVSSADISLAASLQEREQALAKKDKELVAREQKTRELKREIDEKLARLSELQREINEKLDEMKKVQDADFKNLIKVYSTMSATKLSPLLNQMTDENVARILKAMKADQVAKIVPKLESEKAVRVSRLLGGFE
jgi:flagellar motility protein MotE (MotC chaperone)